MSFERTSDGHVRTLDYQTPAKPRPRGIWLVMSVVAAVLISCADALVANRRPAPTLGRPVIRLTGVVCAPISPTTLPATQPAQTQPALAE